MAATPGTLMEVKKYFEYENAARFAAEWKQLTPGDKAELQQLVGEEIAAGRFTP